MSWIELEPVVCQIGIFAILAMSLNVVCGMTGMLQLGHAGFYTAGAYAAGLVAIYASVPALGPLNMAFGTAAAVVMAVVFALIIGTPCLRLRGDYLAIATLAFGEILRLVLNHLTFPPGRMFPDPDDPIGGPTGIRFIDSAKALWPEHPDYRPGWASWWVIWLAVAATYGILRNIKFSRIGRACLCIREDEIAARAMGINVPAYKMLAFMISAAFAGLAGALFFHYRLMVIPDRDFSLLASIQVLLMVVLGGMGSVSGSLVAAVILGAMPTLLSHLGRDISQYRETFFAALLIVLIRLAPDGIFGQNEIPARLSRLFRRRPRRRSEETS
jgi:branched-chain amino acid transport system permease protein